MTEIEWAKVCQVHPDSYVFAATEAGRGPSAGVEDTGRLYAAYEALRRDRQLIDFESVLELTAAILLTEPAVAREVHAAFRYFTVDEFQDVNPLQKLLLDAWLGGREELCVVGDPRQTIYSFTGATSEYLRSFTADYPQATMVRLVRDYRSTPQVVGAANRLVAARLARPSRPPYGRRRARRPRRLRRARRAAAGWPGARGDAVRRRGGGGGRRGRGDRGADRQRRAAAGDRRPAADQRAAGAVRAGAVATPKVPYVVRGAERFYDRPEVRQALVLLRGAARAAGAGTDATGLPGELPAAVRHVLASAGLTAAPPAARGAVRERWESLAAIAGLADNLAAARPGATLAEFAAELAERAETGHAPVAAAVTLATMHAAKGLEWDAVLLPGPDRGHNAHRARANGRGHRGRAAAALRRGHPGAGPPRALLGARADAGRPSRPGSVRASSPSIAGAAGGRA